LHYILAHVRGDGNAVTLAEIVREGEDEAGDEEEPPEESPPPKPSGKGLNAEDFAAFLRRGKQGNV
jgi:hypothetical protein